MLLRGLTRLNIIKPNTINLQSSGSESGRTPREPKSKVSHVSHVTKKKPSHVSHVTRMRVRVRYRARSKEEYNYSKQKVISTILNRPKTSAGTKSPSVSRAPRGKTAPYRPKRPCGAPMPRGSQGVDIFSRFPLRSPPLFFPTSNIPH